MFIFFIIHLVTGQISVPLKRNGLTPADLVSLKRSRDLSDSKVYNYAQVKET